MAKPVYLLHEIGDMGKDNFYYLYDSEEAVEKAIDFINDDVDEYLTDDDDPDEEYEKVVYDARIGGTWFDTMAEVLSYLNKNDMFIAGEYDIMT